MVAHLSLVLLLQAGPSFQSRLEGVGISASAATDAANSAILKFLSTWRTAWVQSVDWQQYGHKEIRLRDDHCHWDGSYSPTGDGGFVKPPSLIHIASRRSMCPNWFPADEPLPGDERVRRDVMLMSRWRDSVDAARAILLDSLDALDKLHPGDALITGQRVRFLVDQGAVEQALRVARACSADRGWCAQLSGFALDAAGDYRRADSAFDAASAAMSPERRCEWTSARLLLDDRGRSAYDRLKCGEREAVDRRLWWLATPLFSDSVSDRRSAHFSRKVLIQLHSALQWDERYDWRARYGGEALSEMLVRYGWPAFSAYGGTWEETSHADWMGFHDSTRTATAEYPQDRLHLVPEWRAVENPLHAAADAWQINMPEVPRKDEPAAHWWPAEHYARAGGSIRQLPDQTAMLRRDRYVLLAMASELPTRVRVQVDTGALVLVRTTAPDSVERLAHNAFVNDKTIVVTAAIASAPAIVGTELRAVGGLSARTRLAVTPPPTLAALRTSETAISDPILISADEGAPPGPESALPRMLGSTRVRGPKVGIYWETYGWTAGDSVDLAVVIARRERITKLRRLGMLLRVARDVNGSVAVRWAEPQPGRSAWTIPGGAPIQARSVRVDLSRLAPGRYSVTVLAAKHGSTLAPVSASRDFVYEGP